MNLFKRPKKATGSTKKVLVENAKNDKPYGLADIFGWWVHEISESDKPERLRQTKKSLQFLTDIGQCKSYYGAALRQELKNLVLERLWQILQTKTDINSLELTLQNAKPQSEIWNLIKTRISQLQLEQFTQF